MAALTPVPSATISTIQAISQAFFHHSTQADAANVRIVTAAIIVLFCVVFFIVALHLYAKWFWRNAHLRPELSEQGYSSDDGTNHSSGLDKAVVESLPTFTFNPGSLANGVECVVCLCEFEEKQKGRFLPICNHIFHKDCIDTWFRSHSTCPLCRVSIVPSTKAEINDPMGEHTLPWRAAPLDFSGLEHFLVSLERSHHIQRLDYGGGIERQVLVPSSAYPQEERPQQKATSKQQSQLSTTVSSPEQEESALAPPLHHVIGMPRSPEPTSFLCPKSPLTRFSLIRILSRDRKICPSASTSACCEEVAFPAL